MVETLTPTPSAASQHALLVCQRLQSAGHVAVFAGGCVRDTLLERQPKDWDVATSATPDQVQALFDHCSDLEGKAFGVLRVRLHDGQDTEVATFRIDSTESDGRRPTAVEFTTDMKIDSCRRDFTVNAMFFDPVARKLHDFHGGTRDARERQLRCVGDPLDRFTEDTLRVLRAARFYSTHKLQPIGMTSAVSTFMTRLGNMAVAANAEVHTALPAERVRGEMARVLGGDNVEAALRWMQNTGVSLLVTSHSWVPSTVAQRLGRVPAEWRERVGFAVVADSQDTVGMRRIHPTNESRLRQVIWEKDLQSAFALANENNVLTRAHVRRALLRREGEGFLHYLSTVTPRKSLAQLLTRDIWTGLKEAPVPFDVAQQRQTLVTGDDLIAAGMKPGPVMGAFMGQLELAVIRRDVLTREEALNMAAIAVDAENR